MSEKPLHVQVAEALGWTMLESSNRMDMSQPHRGYPPHLPTVGQKEPVPDFPTDWSATGPLIEKYGISVIQPDEHAPERADGQWIAGSGGAHGWDDGSLCMDCYAGGVTPLIAVCNLILLLAKEGKLAA